MDISINDQNQERIRRKVETGKYGSPDDVIAGALELPEGQEVEVIQRRGQWISEACVNEGFRFSTRLHIMLWGDKRGR